jgi:hypothetical protein
MIEIPSSVEFIGENCFRGCESLCEITFESGSKLQRIEEEAFRLNNLKMIEIPSSVEFIGEFCFSECQSLYDVRFEGHVREIEVMAFPTRFEDIVKNAEDIGSGYGEKCCGVA